MLFSVSLSRANDKPIKQAIIEAQNEFDGNKKITPARVLKAIARVGLEKWNDLRKEDRFVLILNID